MEETRLVPKRRFQSFREEWEQNKLDNLLEQLKDGTHGTHRNVEKGPYLLSAKNIKNGEIFISEEDRNISVEEYEKIHKYFSLKKGDVLLTIVGSIGESAIIDNPYGYTFQRSVAYLRPNKEINSKFLYAQINSYEFQKKLMNRQVLSAQAGIYLRDLSDIFITFPTIEEQQKIGEFFKVLDECIANQERKIAKVKALKAAYLTEMFPQKGETVPKRRFKGYEDEWGQSYLLDNIKKIIDFRGRTPKKLGLSWSENGYLALSALNVKNGYIDYTVEPHYGDEELYYKWMSGNELKKNQVIFTTEAPMGNVAQVPDNKGYILSQRVIVFDCYEERISNDFLAVLLRSSNINKKLTNLSSGGTAKGVSQKTLESLKVKAPSLKEQQKIGNFFKNLDNQIETEEKKLDKLQKMKEAYLEEMFV